ncbi:hypothetical protein LCGC14_2944110 [marine sediment metagenome]|uniref:Uncharacterized protein n=1 Tax=marine sediment metagenome TaxID=412755 RepID=A0A0F8XH28_9ZZZZ
MKKKGTRCKKFENLERDLLNVINDSKENKTINEIRKDLEKKGIKVSWNTTRDYLESLYIKRKVKKISLGNNIKFLFWGK